LVCEVARRVSRGHAGCLGSLLHTAGLEGLAIALAVAYSGLFGAVLVAVCSAIAVPFFVDRGAQRPSAC